MYICTYSTLFMSSRTFITGVLVVLVVATSREKMLTLLLGDLTENKNGFSRRTFLHKKARCHNIVRNSSDVARKKIRQKTVLLGDFKNLIRNKNGFSRSVGPTLHVIISHIVCISQKHYGNNRTYLSCFIHEND